MSIPKHLMEAKLCNLDTCKLSNTIPNDKDLLNMVAHLVVENANMQRKINQAIEYIKAKGLKEEEWQNGFCISATATYTRDEIFDLLNILQNGSEKDG